MNVVLLRKLNFIKHQPQNFMEKYRSQDSLKRQSFIQKVHMQHLNYLLIGYQKIIESHMEFLHLMEYFLTMSHQEEVKLL